MSKDQVETLDLSSPFERVLLAMRDMHRRKRADYAVDGSPFSNFYKTADRMRARGFPAFTALDSIAFNQIQKDVRIEALTENGRMEQTQNETVRDTLVDHAVYAAIALAVYDEMHDVT